VIRVIGDGPIEPENGRKVSAGTFSRRAHGTRPPCYSHAIWGFGQPRALLLVSLALREKEWRLWDALGWLATEQSKLLSVQRVKRLLPDCSDAVYRAMGEFAFRAAYDGGDRRWSSLAGSGGGPSPRDAKMETARLELSEPATLILRTRLGMGVGAKADILAFLIGVDGGWVSAATIAKATGYSPRAVRRTAEEMAIGGFVQAHPGNQTEYRVDVSLWEGVLGFGATPQWRYWSSAWGFVGALDDWTGGNQLNALSPYLLSSQARDIFETHRNAFAANKIQTSQAEAAKGEGFLDAFAHLLQRFSRWLKDG